MIDDTDSEDELPAGWEEKATPEGWVYYANHLTKTTVWEHPKTKKRKRVPSHLPYGWERKSDEKGRAYFTDTINERQTYTDPRLAHCVDVQRTSAKQLKQRFDSCSTANQVLQGSDLSGKVAIVTGANSGIGFETAKSLALHGCHVILACRNKEKAEQAAKQMSKDRSDAKVTAMELDLASLRSVKQFAKDFVDRGWPLHILILNAAVAMHPWQMTEDDIELTFQTNHVAHFYLTQQLASLLIRSAPARVVVVSSESHRFPVGYDPIHFDKLSPACYDNHWPMIQYNRSKLCNVLFSNELNRRLAKHGVTSNALHPGNLVYSSLSKTSPYLIRLLYLLARPFTKSMQQAAACSVYVATAPELHERGGLYFNNCFRCHASSQAADRRSAKRLWSLSENLVRERTDRWFVKMTPQQIVDDIKAAEDDKSKSE